MPAGTKVIHRYTSIASVIDMLRRREFTLLDPATWDDRNDRYFMELYKERKEIPALYAACAAMCLETYHHWRVFTSGADGACLENKRAPLEDALSHFEGVRFGPVSYLRLEDAEALEPSDAEDIPFLKRLAFQPEDEYRIVLESKTVQAPAYGVELPLDWIKQIRLNPWLPARVAESVKATFREIDGCQRIEVVRSHLIDSGRWKRAGDKLVGRKSPSKIQLRHVRKLPTKK